ncbi:hybrid sensor histidine kinase/response regulator [Prosthecochloris sp.]|uniref:ATP-binding response regulator n=1 Tax=Prosthecochloris sp. TaxID=290513 RepID=UPI00257BCD20|nr:hybrid sensor histidine kinase/response regulator [Prosthecochloris sp.]
MAPRYAPECSPLKRWIEFLRKDYERNEFTIKIGRYVGLWAHPIYYLLWTVILPQPYESLTLRFASTISFIPILFFKHYPASFKPWLNLYWYLWLTFTLPVIFTFLMLMNNFSGMWLVCETMMLLVFIIFVPNYYMLVFLFTSGVLIAYAGFVFSTGTHLVITREIIEYMLPLPMAILLGVLFSYTTRKGAIEQRNKSLQSLAGSIAHEMRNPFGQIRNCLKSIQNMLPFSPSTKEKNTISLDKESVNRIIKSIAQGQNAIKRGVQAIDLVLGEIRENPINPKNFTYLSASQITRKALDEYGYDSDNERNRVRLDTRETFILHIDETLFLFVLFNLLKNAIYYFGGHPKSEIRIRFKKGTQHNYLFFRDTGPGIAKEDLPHIFDSFHTKGKQEGTGLGLAYCKRVMKAFGGNITCDSEKGKYTEFTLAFPVVSNNDLARHNNDVIVNALPDFRGKLLLIVDDEPLYRMTLKKYLLPLEVAFDEAANGFEAMVYAAENRYDLIIMDLNMPQMSGYETAERLRCGEAGAEAVTTPIIAHSAEPAYIAGTMAEKAGMQVLLTKPCSQAELINALHKVLKTGPHKPSKSSLLESSRVLLIDDSALNRKLLAMNLTDTGLKVALAENGAEGWNMLQTLEFDLLITDIRMPEMDGLELTRLLRTSKNHRLRRLPIIGLSGAEEEKETAKSVGMDEFRLKTENPDLLLASIEKLLSSSPSKQPIDCTLPPFNLAPSPESMGLSAADIEDLFKTFLDEFQDIETSMYKALAEQNIEYLRAQAHKLKGNAALFGAEPLRQTAETLEESCRSNQTDELEKQVTDLLIALSALSKHAF